MTFDESLAQRPRLLRPAGEATPVHERVAERAALVPDAVAVVHAGGQLTYGELARWAGRVARRLQQLRVGVGPEMRVAVWCRRGPEMVAGLLGVLEAGGAYVPLDPGHPVERIRLVLEDSRAAALLTLRDLAAELPLLGLPVLALDGLAGEGETSLPEADSGYAGLGQLAYVIYTSGSTGAPKGVEVEHSALLSLVRWHLERYATSGEDRATLLASPAFDASVWELWPNLAAGARLFVPDEEARMVPALLLRQLAEQEVTVSFAPTALAEGLLAEHWPEGLALRRLLTGGEALRRRPPAGAAWELVNHYGPTENAVVATSGVVAAAGEGAPPIGVPIPGVTAHVLDERLQPVEEGAVGEASSAAGAWREATSTAPT